MEHSPKGGTGFFNLLCALDWSLETVPGNERDLSEIAWSHGLTFSRPV